MDFTNTIQFIVGRELLHHPGNVPDCRVSAVEQS
jgi:hypothetical protein